MKNWYKRMFEYIFVTNIFEYLNIFVTLWIKLTTYNPCRRMVTKKQFS